MAQDNSKGSLSRGGGIFMAIGTLGGAIVGGLLGQPSAGLLIGLGGGVLISVVLFLADRARSSGD